MTFCSDLRRVREAAFVLVLFGASSVAQAAEPRKVAACEQQGLTEPQRLQTVTEAQPVLRWEGDASRIYRVQVAVVLPESRILAEYDVNVSGTAWRLPVPVPGSRAALKVLVSSACPELGAQDLHARGAWFFVDRRGGCALAADALRRTAFGLAWQPVAEAQRYRVRWWQAASEAMPRLLGEREVVEPRAAALEGALEGAAGARAVTVQPVCGDIVGEPAAIGWR